MNYLLATILIQQFIILVCGANEKEIITLYEFMCKELTENDEANLYRNTKDWQHIKTIIHNEQIMDKFETLIEWQIRYSSIERWFNYCEKLKTYINSKNVNGEALLMSISLKPKFTLPNGNGILPIAKAMANIVEAYKNIFMGNCEKIFRNCYKKIIKQEENSSEMNFENKEDSIKVSIWAFIYEIDQKIKKDEQTDFHYVNVWTYRLKSDEKLGKNSYQNLKNAQKYLIESANKAKNLQNRKKDGGRDAKLLKMKAKNEKSVQLKLEVPSPPPLPNEFELKNVFGISPNPLRQKNCTKDIQSQNADVQQQYDDLEMQFMIQSTIGMLNEFEDENE